MSPTESWLKIKVVLVSGRAEELDPPPGRVMLVSANHTLAQLAEAIDLALPAVGQLSSAYVHAPGRASTHDRR